MDTMWPGMELHNLPRNVQNAAQALTDYIDMNGPDDASIGEIAEELGAVYLGAGAFNVAYSMGDYVVKVNCGDGNLYDFREAFSIVRGSTPAVQALFCMIMVPTLLFSQYVVIQKRVKILGAKLTNEITVADMYTGEQYHNAEGTVLGWFIEELGGKMSMGDLHPQNWGVAENGDPMIFDPMCFGDTVYRTTMEFDATGLSPKFREWIEAILELWNTEVVTA